MKKVLLLSTNQATTPYPVPPLGLALLYQRLRVAYQVNFLDGFSISSDEVRRQLQEFQPDYIGLSIRNIDDMVKGSTHSYIPGILETYLAPIKEQSRAVLILGGSGFTIFPDELMTVFGA
ncbi:MAG: cobalamin-dependent protein, partial [Desulfobulbaceae bacterium]|nr:cobalamin-dependent protein [Desulfobulbaceae bacterium]